MLKFILQLSEIPRSIISGQNDAPSEMLSPLRMCFWSNQISNRIFHLRNLITWCFLNNCNPITCNLWLPKALSHSHACARARAHSSLSGASVEVNCIPSISWSWCRASGPQRLLERLLENAFRKSICWLGGEEERIRLRENDERWWKWCRMKTHRGLKPTSNVKIGGRC